MMGSAPRPVGASHHILEQLQSPSPGLGASHLITEPPTAEICTILGAQAFDEAWTR